MRAWRDRIRHLLGTQHLPHLEHTMSVVLDSLRALAAQQREASAAQLASFSNLQGAIARLESIVRGSEVDPEITAAVEDLKQGFLTMMVDAQRADDGYEPAEPETPADTEPEVPGGQDVTPPVEVPAEVETPADAPADTTEPTQTASRKR